MLHEIFTNILTNTIGKVVKTQGTLITFLSVVVGLARAGTRSDVADVTFCAVVMTLTRYAVRIAVVALSTSRK